MNFGAFFPLIFFFCRGYNLSCFLVFRLANAEADILSKKGVMFLSNTVVYIVLLGLVGHFLSTGWPLWGCTYYGILLFHCLATVVELLCFYFDKISSYYLED